MAAVSLLFMLIFSILGVQLFGGRFGRCESEDDPAVAATRAACEQAGLLWSNPEIGDFDNTFNGMILLFEIITSEMWPDMLHLMQDASEP